MELIILIVVVLIIYFKFIKKNNSLSKSNSLEAKESSIDDIWAVGDHFKELVLDKSPLSGLDKYLDEERNMVRAGEGDLITLKERFKHDEKKVREIAREWKDFAEAVYSAKTARELIDVSFGDDNDRAFEKSDRAFITIRETTNRIIKELGEESRLKRIKEKQEREGTIAREILDRKE